MAKPRRPRGVLTALDLAALKAIARAGSNGLTYWELQRDLNQLPQTMSPVCFYLRRDNWIAWNGKRRLSQTGSPCMVYVATSRGRKFLAALRKRGAA